MSRLPENVRQAPEATLPDEGCVRMASILVVPGLLAEMGIDPSAVIAEAGLDPALFDSPENKIPFVDLGRFIELCVNRTGCPHLGLLIGETMGTAVLGLVGQLTASSTDIGSALNSLVRYLHLHDRAAVPSIWVSGRRVTLAYTIHEPDVPATEQIYDAAMANAFNILKALAGAQWEPTEVQFSRPRPADIEPYRRFFRARLCFDVDVNAVVFPASWLSCPVIGSDPRSRQAIIQEVQQLLEDENKHLVVPLRRLLRELLIRCADEGKVSLDHVSQLLAVHRRTLNRRLHLEGTSFRTQLDEARYDIARQYLRDTRLSVLKIAISLGYASATPFTRAFRRWSGTTPAAWRSTHQRP
ncbi:MAG: AraC family transcriptional regulator [Pseudomonadota bacterium]|nr:AraC family transcriptional regulator [Pseudomonadota bacterium]